MKNIINPDFEPRRATNKSAGYDIYLNEGVMLKPGEYTLIDTGVVFEDSDALNCVSHDYGVKDMSFVRERHSENMEHYVGLIFPRSSYGFKYGLRFANSICVIDQDYRDSIKLSVTVDKEVTLAKGDRIAQLIFIPWLTLCDEIKPNTKRNGGIGSTGN